MKKFILLLVVAFITLSVKAYKIEVKIKGVGNDTLYLGYIMAKSKYLTDTTMLVNGTGVFKKDTTLEKGLYFMYNKSGIYFDVLIGADQDFKVENDKKDLFKFLKITGAPETEKFVEYRNMVVERNKLFSKDKKKNKKKLDKMADDIRAFENTLSKETFVCSFVKACQEVEVPETDKNGKKLSDEDKYKFIKKHFFDNINFSDEGLLRTEFLHSKIETYLERLVMHNPDSLNKEIDMILTKSQYNEKVYRYVLSTLLNKYSQSKLMGDDAMVVHIAKNYYLKGKAPWADKKFIEKLYERTAFMEHNLLGNKAKDLLLENIHGESVRLYDIEKPYTILAFWEPKCGHCKKVIPKLYKFYQEQKDSLNFEVMAVFSQTEKDKWQEFVQNNEIFEWINAYDPHRTTKFQLYYDVTTTPKVYIINKDKKIVAKRVAVDQIKMIITNENKKEQEKQKGSSAVNTKSKGHN